ncbi:MAG TPA: antitoxin MazE-like protein [Stellaceae bacterium]|nr:antitoxin MazE-like protein [Stellaceae bacterium]
MSEATSRAQRVARRRAKLRAAGLRPVQLWVPDTRDPQFIEECRRQSRLLRERDTAATQAEDEAWYAASAEALRDEEG